MALYKFAGFWRRLIAYAIDYLIINIVFIFLLGIISVAFFAGVSSSRSLALVPELFRRDIASLSFLSIISFYTALYILYFSYFHGIGGRTPGKMLLNIKVVSIDGTPVTFGIAFLRSVGYLFSSIFCLGFIWAAFDRRKQGWHDKIAGTTVIIRSAPDDAVLVAAIAPSSAASAQSTEEQTETYNPPAEKTIIYEKHYDETNTGQHNQSDQKIP